MADEIEALRSVVRKVFGPDEGINVDPEAMRDGDLWWCAAEAIETTAAERAAIDAALAGVAAGPQATPRVLAEDITVLPVLQTGGSIVHLWVDTRPGTRVRVVAAPTDQRTRGR